MPRNALVKDVNSTLIYSTQVDNTISIRSDRKVALLISEFLISTPDIAGSIAILLKKTRSILA
jgi:hypothetical protein